MKRHRGKGSAGSALVMAVITMMVLMILVSALYLMFQMNMKSYMWMEEDLQAMYTAESGANLAGYMIVGGADVPQGDDTVQFLPDTSSGDTWFELPTDELGRVRVFVDPCLYNDIVSNANSYAVRCLARVESGDEAFTYGMETVLAPENFARFACFQENPGTGGFYDDGYTFNGPFHSNGPLCIYSSSSDSDNDPYFYSFTIARPPSGLPGFYYYSQGGASNPTYTPERGNLQMQPIDRLLMGPPYFDLNVDSIPFGPDVVSWGNARHAAINGGLYFAPPPFGVGELDDGTRLMLRDDTLFVREDSLGAVFIYLLSDLEQPVVWIENDPADDVCLKGFPGGPDQAYGVDRPLTIGMNGSLRMNGPHHYENEDQLDPHNDDMLGLITVYGDFIIENDPDNPGGGDDWPEPWETMTDYTGGFDFDAVFMALDGEMKAEDYNQPAGANDFRVFGGYIVYAEGYTSTLAPSGFTIRSNYDTRLMTMHPPYFPQTQRWDVLYWRDWPDLTEEFLTANLF